MRGGADEAQKAGKPAGRGTLAEYTVSYRCKRLRLRDPTPEVAAVY